MRRKINFDNFEFDISGIDFDGSFPISHAGFELRKQENSDIEGDAAGGISQFLINHQKRDEFFPDLDDEEIIRMCRVFDEEFENAEMVMRNRGNSYYEDVGLEKFVIDNADNTLYFLGRRLGIGWYSKIHRWKDRQPIIRTVLVEKLSVGIGGLLSAGGEVGGVE